jgi:hypothetical protein
MSSLGPIGLAGLILVGAATFGIVTALLAEVAQKRRVALPFTHRARGISLAA